MKDRNNSYVKLSREEIRKCYQKFLIQTSVYQENANNY